jgi:hypothetical protein
MCRRVESSIVLPTFVDKNHGIKPWPFVVPYAGLDDGRLALMQNAGLPVAFYGQLTLERGEALDLSGMAVFPYDTRADECGQLGSNSVVRILGSTSYISNEAVMQNWN